MARKLRRGKYYTTASVYRAAMGNGHCSPGKRQRSAGKAHVAAPVKYPQERLREMAATMAAREERPAPPGAGSLPLTGGSQATHWESKARERNPHITTDRQNRI